MPRKTFSTDAAPTPVARYSQACQIGDVVAVAGQVGIDPATGEVVPGGAGAQLDQALRNVRAVLEAAGRGLDDVVRVDCYLSAGEHLPAFNEAYARWFRDPAPARTTVFVGLPGGLDVEVTALAVASAG